MRSENRLAMSEFGQYRQKVGKSILGSVLAITIHRRDPPVCHVFCRSSVLILRAAGNCPLLASRMSGQAGEANLQSRLELHLMYLSNLFLPQEQVGIKCS